MIILIWNYTKKGDGPNANNVKRFDMEKVVIDGDIAFVLYNGWTNDGKLFRNTERFKFKEGKIVENEWTNPI